ncbi:uncharacterized protein LOC127808809 isoform X2 [Diospyros lotus]|uniref:uncharacterized protein LOC127808809 isoform X2 n=1 Tax=Diospyros lotus TaxID=55363 RepID=UPI002258B68E|nr:uncharacterized protein LOC127808809 isoform X2 [Diospyros lotus]
MESRKSPRNGYHPFSSSRRDVNYRNCDCDGSATHNNGQWTAVTDLQLMVTDGGEAEEERSATHDDRSAAIGGNRPVKLKRNGCWRKLKGL